MVGNEQGFPPPHCSRLGDVVEPHESPHPHSPSWVRDGARPKIDVSARECRQTCFFFSNSPYHTNYSYWMYNI